MKLSRFFLLALALLSSALLSAQVDSTEDWRTYDGYKKIQQKGSEKDSTPGTVKYQQNALLDTLISRYRYFNKEYPKISGYRLQLFFGDREKAEKLKERFKKEHQDIKAYVDYYAPNFRLRVGNFRTRIAAYRFMQELGTKPWMPYIVRTEIELPELGIDE